MPGDAGAHLLQELAELHHVRFGGGVPDLGEAFRARGGKQRRLGAGDGRLVEVHRRARQPVRRLEHVIGRGALPRAHRDAARRGASRSSAAPESRRPEARCARGRRAPAAVRAAAPSRAAGRPARDPGCGCATFGARMRSVVLPMPSTSAPRSRSSRAITSTSPIRGTLVSTHSSSVSRHAASSGSAAFLLPSTATRPCSRCPPSISNVDIQLRESPGETPRRDHRRIRRTPAPAEARCRSGRRPAA